MHKLASREVAGLDPYKFMALIGKRVIHPGGRASTEALLNRAQITQSSRVLDVGCGVGTTAIEIAKRHGADVNAVDIAPLMLERAGANVAAVLGQVCPGMQFDTVDDWVHIYDSAGLSELETETGPLQMTSPKGFLADEGFAHSLAIMGRVATRPAHVRKMVWLMSRMAKAVPYLGYILVAGRKPAASR